MRIQSCKQKGRLLQQKVAHDIVETFSELSSDDVRSTSMGANGEDVMLSALAKRVFPYSIECKNQERLNIWAALDQCISNAETRTPLVVIKKNRHRPFVVVPWEIFLKLTFHHHTTNNTENSENGENGENNSENNTENSENSENSNVTMITEKLDTIQKSLDKLLLSREIDQ